MTENVILVDENDVEIGTFGKRAAHLGDGKLHRAFSVHLVDSQGRHLVQKRAAQKMLWPGYWSNACCSHPAPGEQIEDAAFRRLGEELGLRARSRRLYSFEYHARFGSVGSEHELCHVLIARSDDTPVLVAEEVEDVAWMPRQELAEWMSRAPEQFTPWFRMEWDRLLADFPDFDEPLAKQRIPAC
ncbi:isopentenyl-diphosphate Delta-isomerase [Tateyamaria omphalii]|uniref:isopentenyl-diphosphate Delta-isomerase n=1 Tax=Tateyamaria omphalii TaxID=299262 RepID=UPI00167B1560|nr:isopentenyl-diphosphate Delta-isomerase [Tateyamaria omphalii]GGX66712.1 isopentenyl-diphosphate Delta-isomerase [Tateyamaria omphalii]